MVVSFWASAQKELSYDGYYVSIPDSNTMSMFKYYLRFYPDSKTDALAQPKIVAGPVMPPIGPPPGGG